MNASLFLVLMLSLTLIFIGFVIEPQSDVMIFLGLFGIAIIICDYFTLKDN